VKCTECFYLCVLTELREEISKQDAGQSAGQEDYATIETPDSDTREYQELEMSRRWLERTWTMNWHCHVYYFVLFATDIGWHLITVAHEHLWYDLNIIIVIVVIVIDLNIKAGLTSKLGTYVRSPPTRKGPPNDMRPTCWALGLFFVPTKITEILIVRCIFRAQNSPKSVFRPESRWGSLLVDWLGKGDTTPLPSTPSMNEYEWVRIGDFRHLSRRISETVQDTKRLLLVTNKKSNTRFRLVPKSMTLVDPEMTLDFSYAVGYITYMFFRS